VPFAARVVTITALPGIAPPAPVTITDAAAVAKIAAVVDSLPLDPPRVYLRAKCLAHPGGGIQLAFRARPGGQALTVVRTVGDCGSVIVSAGGERQLTLADEPGLDQRILRLAGLRWPGY